jgi:PfaB family protein
MIHRVNAVTNLAIVGMAIALPGGGGIEEFGRLVYRGLPMNDQFDERSSIEEAVIQTSRQVTAQARLMIGQVPVLSLSPFLDGIFQKNKVGSRVQVVSGCVSALATAAEWLESGGEDLVLIVEAHENPQAVCSLLVSEYKSALDNARPVYALVTGAAETDGLLSNGSISNVLEEARRGSSITQETIGIIQAATITSTGINADEAQGLKGAFDTGHLLTCALSNGLGGLLGVVKAIWCLTKRVIPGVPRWSESRLSNAWDSSPFYVATESRAWFLPSRQENRHIGLDILEKDGRFAHILFREIPNIALHKIEAPRQEALRLFPFTADSIGQIIEMVTALKSKITAGTSMTDAAKLTYKQSMHEKVTARYTACLLGQTPSELLREIDFAVKGIPIAFEKQTDWQTPLGSFFTPNPLGKEGKVAFVYPGAFNSYPGIGRDLFYLFPNLYDQLNGITGDIGDLLNERLLYPRSMAPLTAGDLAAIEAQLSNDPMTMLISGSCLAFLYTNVLRHIFEIHPASAFGYSLGEVSMLFASQVWNEADKTSKTLRESPLFHTRLTGPQNAVREYWNLPPGNENNQDESIWVNYLLMIGPEKVREILPEEEKVFLTHINTPRQVVIGGDPTACRRVINRLKCKSIQAPFNYAIHCRPMQSEYEMLTKLHSVPVVGQPGMTLYSAATFEPMPIDQQKIAEQIAYELCHCLDFPRLIQLAYQDGASIFIELGAGSNCARWVNDTLEGKPHAAYSINRKGVDDHTSILRLLARMVSHHVQVNLSVLYQD